MSIAFVIIKMCYVHNQWYDISCATLFIYLPSGPSWPVLRCHARYSEIRVKKELKFMVVYGLFNLLFAFHITCCMCDLKCDFLFNVIQRHFILHNGQWCWAPMFWVYDTYPFSRVLLVSPRTSPQLAVVYNLP